MSKDQIDEIAIDLCNDKGVAVVIISIDDNGKPRLAGSEKYLQNLIAKGWRKQSEGEWKALTSICFDYICTNCGESAITYEDQYYTERYHLTKYCPNCGAKMKGGAE